MSLVEFDALPDHARLWCFGADPAPAGSRTTELLEASRRFVDGWTAHRLELAAAADFRDGRFLFVGVDETAAGASGCSIDALMGHIREMEERFGLSLLDGSRIWYRDGDGRVRAVTRGEFRRLSREPRGAGPDAEVGSDTEVRSDTDVGPDTQVGSGTDVGPDTQVGPDTRVFDLAITTVRDLRAGRFERPARDSWHARLLEVRTPEPGARTAAP